MKYNVLTKQVSENAMNTVCGGKDIQFYKFHQENHSGVVTFQSETTGSLAFLP